MVGNLMTKLEALELPVATIVWSEPFTESSEFTMEDPLAFDYLAQQIGIWLFPGFTTRTTRAQYYPMVLYGLHLADKAVRVYDYPDTDLVRRKLFERWEKFWALATVESHGGRIGTGHPDSMRGIKGALSVWKLKGELPLDFKLIERQLELGGLGAYLSSLRYYNLVGQGSFKPLPIAKPIIENFWRSTGWFKKYENFALEALNLESVQIPRKLTVTLATLGQLSRLTAVQNFSPQQDLISRVLFTRGDSTTELANCLIQATRLGMKPTKEFLKEIVNGSLGDVSSQVRDSIKFSIIFGEIYILLLDSFNQIYNALLRKGWSNFNSIAKEVFSVVNLAAIREASKRLLSENRLRGIAKLNFHGPQFSEMIQAMTHSDSNETLRILLKYHRQVQKSRHGGTSWIREDQDQLKLVKSNYNGHERKATFPDFKFSVVLGLLNDLGRLQDD